MDRMTLSNGLFRTLALVAGAFALAPVAQAGQVLDWDAQAYTSGSLTGGPYTLGNGSVSVAITGDTDDFNNATPDDLNTIVDDGSNQENLTLSIDYDNGAGTHEVTVTFTFTHPNGVRDIAFSIFDVDFGAGQFIDQVQITATNASGTINPSTITAGTTNAITLGNTATGNAAAANNTTQGNVTVAFNQTGITSLTIVYRNTIASGSAGQQFMGIHDITFTPEADLSTSTKTVVDTNGGNLLPGDTLRYTVTVNNAGGVAATAVSVRDDVPANISSFSMFSIPGGATNNSTAAPAGANGTGLVEVDGFSVAAGGSATVVFDAVVSGTAPTGTNIDNSAQIYNTIDDVVVSAPTMTVNAQVATGVVKQLYLDNAAGNDLTRTRPTGTTSTAINESTSTDFDLDPDTSRSLTLASGIIPITLRWACNGNNANRAITVTLSTTSGTVVAIGSQGPTTIACPGGSGAGTVFGTSTFNVNLAATTTFVSGTNFRLNVAVGAGSGARNINLRPVEGGVYSRVDLNVLNPINVDTLGAYTATYNGGVLQTDYQPATNVFLRAVISDPFGAYDISPVGGTTTTITIRDRNNTNVVTNATMTLVNTGTATKTYEYNYSLLTGALPGDWDYIVTAYEGVEGTVTDTLSATFTVVMAEISITKTSAVITDPVRCTSGSLDPATCGANNPLRIPGAVVRYTITMANASTATATATAVTTTDVIPANTTFVSPSIYRSADATCNSSDVLQTNAFDAGDTGSISGSTITLGDSNGGTDLSLAIGASQTYCYHVTIN
jgi:uncharacterized repeat protein (TIGR01451 family)